MFLIVDLMDTGYFAVTRQCRTEFILQKLCTTSRTLPVSCELSMQVFNQFLVGKTLIGADMRDDSVTETSFLLYNHYSCAHDTFQPPLVLEARRVNVLVPIPAALASSSLFTDSHLAWAL